MSEEPERLVISRSRSGLCFCFLFFCAAHRWLQQCGYPIPSLSGTTQLSQITHQRRFSISAFTGGCSPFLFIRQDAGTSERTRMWLWYCPQLRSLVIRLSLLNRASHVTSILRRMTTTPAAWPTFRASAQEKMAGQISRRGFYSRLLLALPRMRSLLSGRRRMLSSGR